VVLVDTCVWIDWFAGNDTPQVQRLAGFLGTGPDLLVGDLILTEVLQGTPSRRVFEAVARDLERFEQVRLCGTLVAKAAARHFQVLRGLGVTPRQTIDTVIATWCIVNGVSLLTRDRDFAPFAQHLGLQLA
jgi:predicted nucleic acid-binding protein